MDLEEFKKRLGAEPRSNDAELLEARRASVQHMAIARDADGFEDRLESALQVPVPDSLAEDILGNCLGESNSEPARGLRWSGWALAATVTLAVGLTSVLLTRPVDAVPLREAFVGHLEHPEPAALASSDVVDDVAVSRTFAQFGADLNGDVGKITYLSRCRIGSKAGIHLVVTDAAGAQTTVMFLADETMSKSSDSFEIERVSARMLATPTGVIALFGHQGQDLSDLSLRFLESLGGDRIAFL